MKEIRFSEVDDLKKYNENKYESCTMLEYLHSILGEEECNREIDETELRGRKNWDSTRF